MYKKYKNRHVKGGPKNALLTLYLTVSEITIPSLWENANMELLQLGCDEHWNRYVITVHPAPCSEPRKQHHC